MLSCEFCKIFKNTFFRLPSVAASSCGTHVKLRVKPFKKLRVSFHETRVRVNISILPTVNPCSVTII